MAGGLRRACGKIFWLLEEIEEYEPFIRADLVRAGLSLDEAGSGRSTWGNILAVVETAGPDSAYVRARQGEDAWWTPEVELAAQVVDRLNHLIWQNAGSPAGQRPQRLPRPGDKTKGTYGAGESWTPESMDAWIAAVEAEHADGQVDTVVTFLTE